jgi:hypothetical protein
MTQPENRSYLDVGPTLVSLLNHYNEELKKAVANKNIERVKVIKSVLLCLVPGVFKIN